MSDFPPARLGGEIDPDAWNFSRMGEDGPLPNPTGHTFPLLTHDSDGRWRLVGTGFYVNDSGFFVTARHVVEDVLQNGEQISPLVILHLHSPTGLFGPSESHLRPIMQCWLDDVADVALGVAAPATSIATGEIIKNWTWTLSWLVPPIGTLASTYAFPNHTIIDNGRRFRFAPHAYGGRIDGFGDTRDALIMPFPYLQVGFRIHGAASGGPILSGGHVIGINCTELQENIDHPPGPGFGAQSRCVDGAFLDQIVLPGESTPRCVTFDELVRAGCINVANYTLRNPSDQPKGKLVQLHMRVTAPLPAIEIEAYV